MLELPEFLTVACDRLSQLLRQTGSDVECQVEGNGIRVSNSARMNLFLRAHRCEAMRCYTPDGAYCGSEIPIIVSRWFIRKIQSEGRGLVETQPVQGAHILRPLAVEEPYIAEMNRHLDGSFRIVPLRTMSESGEPEMAILLQAPSGLWVDGVMMVKLVQQYSFMVLVDDIPVPQNHLIDVARSVPGAHEAATSLLFEATRHVHVRQNTRAA